MTRILIVACFCAVVAAASLYWSAGEYIALHRQLARSMAAYDVAHREVEQALQQELRYWQLLPSYHQYRQRAVPDWQQRLQPLRHRFRPVSWQLQVMATESAELVDALSLQRTRLQLQAGFGDWQGASGFLQALADTRELVAEPCQLTAAGQRRWVLHCQLQGYFVADEVAGAHHAS